MGWTVLYIAFGVVALWLLGEVLLQYKARLRWRLLAFVGFLGVVVGVLIPSVVVIGIGAATFAVGQTYVTLSFRRGFSTGWAIGGGPGGSRRRRTEGADAEQDPTLQVSDVEYGAPYPPEHAPEAHSGAHPDAHAEQPADFAATQASPVYAPEPMPDDTMQYGVYTDASSFPPPPAPAAAPAGDYGYDGYATTGYEQDQYGYDNGQYAAYSDPYIGTQAAYNADYDSYGGQQGYDPGYAAQEAAYPGGYPGETPPGGVWVPQQRTGDDQQQGGAELPPEQPYPYQDGYGTGYDGQQQAGYQAGYNDQQQYRY
ncbi:SCO2102 family sporulation regulator [Streptomyces sp. NPDC002851]